MTSTILTIVSAMAMLATASFGQQTAPTVRMTAEQFYKSSPDVRQYYNQFQYMPPGSRPKIFAPPTTSPGSGDQFVAYLYTADQNFGVGDIVRPRLVVVNSTDPFASNGVSVYGRLLTPGPSGQYDQNGGIIYIQPDNGSYGYYRGGFGGSETIPLYSLLITTNMNFGEYLFDFSIVDAQSGALIQQLFARFFLNQTGPYGKGLYTVNGVTTFAANGSSYVTLQGDFPASSTVDVFYGTPLFGWSQGPMMTDSTGHFITLPTNPIAPAGYQGVIQSQDVIVHFPQIRESISLHNAFSVQTNAPTAVPVSQ